MLDFNTVLYQKVDDHVVVCVIRTAQHKHADAYTDFTEQRPLLVNHRETNPRRHNFLAVHHHPSLLSDFLDVLCRLLRGFVYGDRLELLGMIPEVNFIANNTLRVFMYRNSQHVTNYAGKGGDFLLGVSLYTARDMRLQRRNVAAVHDVVIGRIVTCNTCVIHGVVIRRKLRFDVARTHLDLYLADGAHCVLVLNINVVNTLLRFVNSINS
jgi:hypothetical protein